MGPIEIIILVAGILVALAVGIVVGITIRKRTAEREIPPRTDFLYTSM